jgi:DNA repair exonuclease SbcCD ATPase subunit
MHAKGILPGVVSKSSWSQEVSRPPPPPGPSLSPPPPTPGGLTPDDFPPPRSRAWWLVLFGSPILLGTILYVLVLLFSYVGAYRQQQRELAEMHGALEALQGDYDAARQRQEEEQARLAEHDAQIEDYRRRLHDEQKKSAQQEVSIGQYERRLREGEAARVEVAANLQNSNVALRQALAEIGTAAGHLRLAMDSYMEALKGPSAQDARSQLEVAHTEMKAFAEAIAPAQRSLRDAEQFLERCVGQLRALEQPEPSPLPK